MWERSQPAGSGPRCSGDGAAAMTAAERDAAPFADEWMVGASATERADRPAVAAMIAELYALHDLRPPEVMWVDSPAEARLVEDGGPDTPGRLGRWRGDLLVSEPPPRRGCVARAMYHQRFAELIVRAPAHHMPDDSAEIPWWEWSYPDPGGWIDSWRGISPRYLSSTHCAVPLQCLSEWPPRWRELWTGLNRGCGWWWPYENVCVVSDRPTHVRAEPWQRQGRPAARLHCADDAAVRYRDGHALYFWHGVEVSAAVIAGEVTPAEWMAEPDVEVRRAIEERMGYQWLLDGCGANRIAKDDFGTLWLIPNPPPQPIRDDFTGAIVGYDPSPPEIVVVEVLNSTREPDGSRKRYVLRVPPDQTSPRDAIGWTFGLPPGTYRPELMT